ncbi:MAG: two-component sensor histidine kinase [Phycisphaerae bacterium]|nr:two-component sensor histidine kinase [Phycisphaerae bacterium]
MTEQDDHTADLIVELSAAAGGLAHEIRNALSTLRMNLQLLDEDWGRLEEDEHRTDFDAMRSAGDRLGVARRSRKRLDTLLRETRRLESILEDFLQFIRRRELKIEDADLNQVIAEIVEFYRPQADAGGLQMLFSPADQPLPCRIDVRLIKQAVLNLLINAQQAAGMNGRLSIATSCHDDGTYRIRVSDSGPGIPSDQIGRVFEAYYSTKKGGTGLGLTLARQIVQAHAGHIIASSPPGEGACFTIELAAHPQSPTA